MDNTILSGQNISKSYADTVAVYAPLPGNLTVFQNLSIFARLYSVNNIGGRIVVLLERFALTGFRNTSSLGTAPY